MRTFSVFVFLALVLCWVRAYKSRDSLYPLDVVLETERANYFNRTVPYGSSILTTEVQIRYRLRPDIRVLSRDGITGPYKEIPDYEITQHEWINKAR